MLQKKKTTKVTNKDGVSVLVNLLEHGTHIMLKYTWVSVVRLAMDVTLFFPWKSASGVIKMGGTRSNSHQDQPNNSSHSFVTEGQGVAVASKLVTCKRSTTKYIYLIVNMAQERWILLVRAIFVALTTRDASSSQAMRSSGLPSRAQYMTCTVSGWCMSIASLKYEMFLCFRRFCLLHANS